MKREFIFFLTSLMLIAGSAVVDGKIYVIGGAPFQYGGTTVVEEYNPAADTWTRRADMPTARQGLVAAAVDGIIYAIGGNCGQPIGDVDLSTVEAYDPATDTWTKKADMPTARSLIGAAACVVDGQIYVSGGSTRIGFLLRSGSLPPSSTYPSPDHTHLQFCLPLYLPPYLPHPVSR